MRRWGRSRLPNRRRGALKPQAAEEGPFTATFSNGVEVQLVGLSENPSQGKTWWAPDGTPLPNAPYARVPANARDILSREVCWRWINLPDDPDVETNWGFDPPNSGGGGGVAFDAAGKQIEGLTAWAISLPKSPDTCAVRFSVSVRATPWATVFTGNGRNRSAESNTTNGIQQGAIFGEAIADKGGTTITVSYQLPGQAVRLLAVDKDGLLDRATESGGGVLNFVQQSYHFAHLSPDKIERYELQAQSASSRRSSFAMCRFIRTSGRKWKSCACRLRNRNEIPRVPQMPRARPKSAIDARGSLWRSSLRSAAIG